MIRVNVNTLTADRTQPPKHVRGLTDDALRNLQAVLNPVPADLLGYEWWPEVEASPEFNALTHKLGADLFTVNAESKTVTASHYVVELTTEEIEKNAIEAAEVAAEAKRISDKALKLSGVLFQGVMCSALAEDQWGLSSIKIVVDSGQTVNYKFENGNVLAINTANYAALYAVWVPFRNQFFI
jgi:hypothetical protein